MAQNFPSRLVFLLTRTPNEQYIVAAAGATSSNWLQYRWMEGTWTSRSALVVVIRVYSDFAFLLAQNIFSQTKPNDQ
jgi:ribosomal protein S2